MFTQHNRLKVLLPLLVLLALFATPALAVPPSLFYSLLSLNHSQATCMNRAYASVTSEISGKINKRADNISLVNNDYNIGVHCRNTGKNKSFVTIVVAHRTSFQEAKGVALNIRAGIKSGINE